MPSRKLPATPARATWPIPSPIRLSRRWTRKKPTAGASSPTTVPLAKASRMNSGSRMDMRRVVPGCRQLRGRAVEDDRAADEHQPVDVGLDSAELMRDVEDRRPELFVELLEELGERSLRLDVDPGGRLVEHEHLRLAGERLRDECSLLLATRQPRQRPRRERRQPHASDRLVDDGSVGRAEQPERPPGDRTSGRQDRTNYRQRFETDLRTLLEVVDQLTTLHT